MGYPWKRSVRLCRVAQSWLLTDGTTPRLDRALGERRARAAIMILLALPGSTYIYQGDELGLQEVGDLPLEVLEDPMATRSTTDKGRDGCRVPLPWTPEGPSYGFRLAGRAPATAGLVPQLRGERSGERSRFDTQPLPAALALRGHLFAGTDLAWVASGPSVLHFESGPAGSGVSAISVPSRSRFRPVMCC